MDGRKVEETVLRSVPPCLEAVNLFAFNGEYLVDIKHFTPEVRDMLTIRPVTKQETKVETAFPLFEVHRTDDPSRPSMVGIPRAFAHARFPNARVIDNRPKPAVVENAMFQVRLTARESQLPAIEHISDTILTHPSHGAILTLPCGTGKTFAAFAIAQKLSQKLKRTVPLIAFVYNDVQYKQWAQRARMYCGTSARIGFLRQKKRPAPDCNVIICMMGTVRNLESCEVLNAFRGGLAVFDEAHHLGSPKPPRAIADSVPCDLRLAITATLGRSDAAEHAISYCVGPHVYEADRIDWQMDVRTIRYTNPNFAMKTNRFTGKLDYTKSVTQKFADAAFMKVVADVLRRLATEEKRHIIVTCRRVAPLRQLHEMLGKELSGLLIGASKNQDAVDKPICLSSESITRECLDHDFDCIVPISSVAFDNAFEQLLGRVTRSETVEEGARLPLLVDIYYAVAMWNRHFSQRLAFCKKHDFNITRCGLDGAPLNNASTVSSTQDKRRAPTTVEPANESKKMRQWLLAVVK